MKIAISGKGGSGKTTISATLTRILARRGLPVLAI
ncbi:MAG: ATP-binding protein, partial [Acidobacteriota bacterium]|nr:ATP-binding protein [Acidobacteriota bacterium]